MLRRRKDGSVANKEAPRRKLTSQSSPNLDSSLTCTAVIMQVPVVVVGRHDYDIYRDAIDKLKDTGSLLYLYKSAILCSWLNLEETFRIFACWKNHEFMGFCSIRNRDLECGGGDGARRDSVADPTTSQWPSLSSLPSR